MILTVKIFILIHIKTNFNQLHGLENNSVPKFKSILLERFAGEKDFILEAELKTGFH